MQGLLSKKSNNHRAILSFKTFCDKTRRSTTSFKIQGCEKQRTNQIHRLNPLPQLPLDIEIRIDHCETVSIVSAIAILWGALKKRLSQILLQSLCHELVQVYPSFLSSDRRTSMKVGSRSDVKAALERFFRFYPLLLTKL